MGRNSEEEEKIGRAMKQTRADIKKNVRKKSGLVEILKGNGQKATDCGASTKNKRPGPSWEMMFQQIAPGREFRQKQKAENINTTKVGGRESRKKVRANKSAKRYEDKSEQEESKRR